MHFATHPLTHVTVSVRNEQRSLAFDNPVAPITEIPVPILKARLSLFVVRWVGG